MRPFRHMSAAERGPKQEPPRAATLGAPQPETDFPDPAKWVRRRKYLRLIEIEEREARASTAAP